jgi:hypothetical protein
MLRACNLALQARRLAAYLQGIAWLAETQPGVANLGVAMRMRKEHE